MSFSETGQYDQGAAGRLPKKVAGEHRWIAAASYTLTDDQARRGYRPGEQVHLDHENRVMIDVGCWDCEQSYETVKDQPCGAPAAPEDASSQPVTDPKDASVDLPPAGSDEMKLDMNPDRMLELDSNVVLADGFGVQPVFTASHDVPGQTDVQCLLSLTGRVNKSDDEVHHLYMLQPSSVGLLAAQLAHGIICMGPEAGPVAMAAMYERLNELEAT